MQLPPAAANGHATPICSADGWEQVLSDRIPSDLAAAQAAFAAILHWPDNLGIVMRHLAGGCLVVYVHGLADEERIRLWVAEPLERLLHTRYVGVAAGTLTLAELESTLPALRLRRVDRLAAAVKAVLEGATALVVAGAAGALVIETQTETPAPVVIAPKYVVFGPGLGENVTLLRQRLRDPALLARTVELPRGRAATAAVMYMAGRAAPELVAAVQDWLRSRAGEEALRRGRAAGATGRWGLVPATISANSPDRVAALLDVGYVAVLVDRIPFVLVAPTTAAALVYGPGDENLRRPLAGLLRPLPIGLAAIAVFTPALVVAVLEFHQEMVPTPFLLSIAATREGMGWPVLLQVLVMELLSELTRAATFRLPWQITAGQSLLAFAILAMFLTLVGILGPVLALVSLVVAVALLGLPSDDLAHIARSWRWPLIFAAGFMGLFGMAVVAFLGAVYFTQARSFQVPFLGETGLKFTSAGSGSSRLPPAPTGTRYRWKGGTALGQGRFLR